MEMPQEKLVSSQEKHKELLSFFNLNEQEIVELKERITKAKGTIRMFVHPLYESWEDYRGLREYGPEEGFRRIARLSEDQTPPIFILEEHGDRSQHKLDKMINAANQKLYIVETLPGEGTLYPDESFPKDIVKYYTKYDSQNYEIDKQRAAETKIYEQKVFDFFAEKLKDLGVENVLIGGMYLWFHDSFMNTLDPEYNEISSGVTGCMAYPIKSLSKHLQVTVSHFTKPGRQKFIKKFGRTIGPQDHKS